MTSNLTRRILAVLVCSVVLTVSLGCGEGGRAAVSGNVTFDGAPIDGGLITFIGEGAKVLASAEIVGGKYSLTGKNGPIVGKNRVEIRWEKKTGKKIATPGDDSAPMDQKVQVVAPQFNKNSVLSAEVQSGASYDFKVSSR